MIEKIARTGRVQDWIDNPENKLPVSCTVYDCTDSCEVPKALKPLGALPPLLFGTQQLRHQGHENGKGLTASGPVSFGKVYSTLNEVLERPLQRSAKYFTWTPSTQISKSS